MNSITNEGVEISHLKKVYVGQNSHLEDKKGLQHIIHKYSQLTIETFTGTLARIRKGVGTNKTEQTINIARFTRFIRFFNVTI